jgi:hypothetical protein
MLQQLRFKILLLKHLLTLFLNLFEKKNKHIILLNFSLKSKNENEEKKTEASSSSMYFKIFLLFQNHIKP